MARMDMQHIFVHSIEDYKKQRDELLIRVGALEVCLEMCVIFETCLHMYQTRVW